MSFSWKRIGKMVLLVLTFAALGAGVFLLASSRKFNVALAGVMRGEREHYFDCYEMPFYPEVEKVLTRHEDVVEKLKDAGVTSILANKISCKNFEQGLVFIKGDLEIHYQTRGQKLAIEKIIGDNFFGIPYRGVKETIND